MRLLLAVGLPFAFWAYRRAARAARPRKAQPEDSGVRHDSEAGLVAEVLRDPVFWVLLTGVLGAGVHRYDDLLSPELHDGVERLAAAAVRCVFAGLGVDNGRLRFGDGRADRPLSDPVRDPAVFPCAAWRRPASRLAFSGPAMSLFAVMVLLGISYGFSSTLFGCSVAGESTGPLTLGSVRSITVSAAVFATAAGPGADRNL